MKDFFDQTAALICVCVCDVHLQQSLLVKCKIINQTFSHFDVSSDLLRSLWVRRSLLLYLPSLVVRDQHCPHRYDWSLHRPTRGQQVSDTVYYNTNGWMDIGALLIWEYTAYTASK